jgi:glycosyltransferase involved in cell wall biosynthesis
VDELERRGVFNVVFTDNLPSHFKPEKHAFRVEDLPRERFAQPLTLVSWLEERLDDLDIDVVHAHSTHFPANLAFFVRNKPVICSPWDFVYSRDPFSPIFHKAILEELPHSRLTDAISFSSKAYMEEVLGHGLDEKRAFWHSWGVDLSVFSPGKHARAGANIRRKFGISRDDTVFLSPRTPSLPANVDIAMQSVAELCRSHPAKLIVTGHHITRESGYYSRLLARPDIAASTIFLDTVREDVNIAALYEAADIIFSIHSNDFNPATVLEAFAMERPVLVHDLKTVTYWVKEKVNGWLVPDRDLPSTVAQLHAIVEQERDTWRAMGREGRERVVRWADLQKTMDRLPEDYQQVISLARRFRKTPLTDYDKGLLFDICGHAEQAAVYYRSALERGEDRPLLPQLLEEQTAMARPDRGLAYFCSKRSQPLIRTMAESAPSEWPELAKRLPVPQSLFRHDYIAGMLPLLRTREYDKFHRLVEFLAEHYATDTLEWIGEAILLFGRRFGLWEECEALLSHDKSVHKPPQVIEQCMAFRSTSQA